MYKQNKLRIIVLYNAVVGGQNKTRYNDQRYKFNIGCLFSLFTEHQQPRYKWYRAITSQIMTKQFINGF